jgi:hypothetical protein
VRPKYDTNSEVATKLNGQWFVGPKEYGVISGSLGFFWPSKTPANKEHAEREAPEFVPSGQGRSSNFYDVGIEIFLRSNDFPAAPIGYQLIELAQKNDWIASRALLRPGLEQIKMKHVMGPRGYFIDHVTYYVALGKTGSDGLPPVATCNHDGPSNAGGTGFMWRPGIWVGTRWNQKHCADLPEIYQEVVRVLSLLKQG